MILIMSKIFFVLLTIIALTGCERATLIDDIKILSSKGYDLKDGQLHGSASYPKYVSGEEEEPVILTGKAKTKHGLFVPYDNQSSSTVEYGKTMVIVYSHHLAEKGISDYISSLIRDQKMGSNAFVVVSKQEAKNIIKVEMTKPPFYLADLIKVNIEKNNTPANYIHSLLFQYFGSGQDVYLPYIKVNQRGGIEMDGIAVFQKDRMKLHLNAKESLYLKLLKDDKKIGKFDFSFRKGENTVDIFGQSMSGKTKMTVKNLTSSPQILIKLSLNCLVTDAPFWINLSSKQDVQLIQKTIERIISKETKNLLIKFQKNNVDPVGIGDFVRGRDRDWNEETFYKIYPKIKLDVKTEIKILQSGVGE